MRVLYVAAALACSAALAAPAVARPGAPAPRSGPTSPPPAWMESSGGERWLLFSSYCWTKKGARPVASCADFIPPTMRPDLPRIVLRAGERVRLHLGFRPTTLSVTVGKRTYRLPASATAVWHARVPAGVATLSARGRGGSASYVARFVIRPAAN
jgi:hypothetical protein